MDSQNTQAVTTKTETRVGKSAGKDIRSLLDGEEFKSQVARALPAHLKPDRFIRVACTTLMRVPKLAECSQVSFFNSLLTLSQLGIEPDGRRAHLIPFWNNKLGVYECQLIVDYKGLVELAMRAGNVSNIHADVVCENDEFEYDRGELKRHKIDFRKPRGSMFAVYALVRFKDGTEKTEVMTKEEVDSIRARSKSKDAGPWVSDYNEMAKKTAFRRLSKWIILSPEVADALDQDGDVIEINTQPVVKPANVTKMFQTVGDTRVIAAPVTEPVQEVEPVQAEKESKPKEDHPREILERKCEALKISFDDLKSWNATQDPQMPGLGDDAIGFQFLTRTQSNAILRVIDAIAAQLKENASV